MTRIARAKTNTKALLGVWPMAKALTYVVDDSRWGLRERLGRIQSESGSIHCTLKLDESMDYVEVVFNDYRTYGGLNYLGGAAAEVNLESAAATWGIRATPGSQGRSIQPLAGQGLARCRAQLGRPGRY